MFSSLRSRLDQSLKAKLLLKELLIGIPRTLAGKGFRRFDQRDRILVFDERLPTPDRDAGSLRTLRVLKVLAERYQVIFIPYTRNAALESVLTESGIDVADVSEYRWLLKNARATAAILNRPSMAELFLPTIKRLSPNTRIIFDTVDVHFVRLQREYELTQDADTLSDANRHRKLETDLTKAADVVWCASIDDKRLLANEAGEANFAIIPTLHEVDTSGIPFAKRSDLLFVGSFLHRPNADAMLYFVREIYPLITRQLPDVVVNIVGADPPDELKAYNSEHLRVLGYVPDLKPYLRGSRIFIAPLRYGGAGTKGKVGEALAHGLPVVTTSIGAEGFGLTNDADAAIADEPDRFATRVADVYNDEQLWLRLSVNGQRIIEDGFSPAAVEAAILRSIHPGDAQN